MPKISGISSFTSFMNVSRLVQSFLVNVTLLLHSMARKIFPFCKIKSISKPLVVR